MVLACVCLEPGNDSRLWQRANEPVNQFPIFEDEHCRNTLDLKLCRGSRILVNVEFSDAIAAVGFGGKLLHDGPYHATWPTPWRPTVQEHGSAIVQHIPPKGIIRHD